MTLSKLFSKDETISDTSTPLNPVPNLSIQDTHPIRFSCPIGLTPGWELWPEKIDTLKQVVLDVVEKYDDVDDPHDCDKKIMRQLLPSDVGLKVWRTPVQVSDSWDTWIEIQLETTIGIYGITQLSYNPHVIQLEILMSGEEDNMSRYGILDLSQLYSALPVLRKIDSSNGDKWEIDNLIMQAYFDRRPYIIRRGTTIKINTYCESNNSKGDRLILLGYIMEPNKKNVDV